MSWHRIMALARRIITQLRRDRRTLALVFFVPVMILSLLGYLYRMEAAEIKLGIVTEEMTLGQAVVGGPSFSDRILTELTESEDFEIQELTRDQVIPYLERGEVKGVIIFPPHYTRRALLGRRLPVDLVLEGSNLTTNNAIKAAIAQAFPAGLLRFLRPEVGAAIREESGTAEIRVSYQYGGEEYDELDYFAPGFIGYFTFFFVFLLTMVSFLRERTLGTLERLMASPLTRAEMVLGYMIGFGIVALIQSIIIVLFSIIVLNIHCAGSLLIVFIIVAILAAGSVNLGIFLSTFARTEFQAVQFIPLVIIPQGLLSGIFWLVEDMPEMLQLLAYIMPLTYANNALRDVMIRGYGLTEGDVFLNVLVLLIFAGAMVLLASVTLRQEVA